MAQYCTGTQYPNTDILCCVLAQWAGKKWHFILTLWCGHGNMATCRNLAGYGENIAQQSHGAMSVKAYFGVVGWCIACFPTAEGGNWIL